jgi:N-acetylneuraminate synthase
VKRPGTGELKAVEFDSILGRRASRDLPVNVQLRRADLA